MHPDLKKQLASQPDYYHGRPVSAEDLMDEMNMAGVDMALIWQNPAATVYKNDPEADYNALLEANRYIFNTAVKHPNRFIPAGWTDPKSLGPQLAKKLVKVCVQEFGFAIVKMNPAQNAFPIDSQPVTEVFDYIVSLGAVPAFHFGADTEFTPAEGLGNLAKRFPEHPLIGVHMGGGGASYPIAEDLYQKARQLGLEFPNIRFILSAKRDTHIESDLITYTLAGEPYASNIFCGSDAPYGRMTWNFGGYRSMFGSLINGQKHTDVRVRNAKNLFTEATAARYMGGNMASFMIESYTSLLEKNLLPE
ncbi:MAG: amidohydrolase family protein [Bacteroidales bacterium]|nr:amidohydrolase family protein [Bacteroidales bacterium]